MTSHSNRVGRQLILEVAEDLFTERGYRAVSIRDIAQKCEVTNAALYYHFPSKEALFGEVMEFHAAGMKSHMSRAAESKKSFIKKAEAILSEYARITVDRRSPLFMLRRDAVNHRKTHTKEQFGRLIHIMLEPLEDVLNDAISAGELRKPPPGFSPASLLVGMLHGHLQHLRTYQGSVIKTGDVRLVVELFWNALSPIQSQER
jgi:AcrR family transcriptional regulator